MHFLYCSSIVLAFTVVSSARSGAEEKDWQRELEKGYVSHSKQPLSGFLNDWHAKSKPVSPEVLKKKPEFERVVYDLYRAFFKPAEEYYKDTHFIVIQRSIEVRILDSGLSRAFDGDDPEALLFRLPAVSKIECSDFRPELSFDGKKLLYLDDDHLGVMLGFLTEAEGGRMLYRYHEEDCEAKERKDRLEYLNSAMVIFPGHWGLGWHFDSHPHVDMIYLSVEFNKAVVLYRVCYGGAAALMTRGENGVWTRVSTKGNWVE